MNQINKVASVSLLFWLLKIVATTLGETLGDYVSMTLNFGYVVGILITAAFFVFAIGVQLAQKKFNPVVYWLVIISTTTLGTEISDFLDRTLHLGYAFGSLFLVACLGLVLFIWWKKYQNLAVFPIFERTKEIYYWAAILFSNSLGTAFGDFLSDNMGLGYVHGAFVTGGIILFVFLLHQFTKLSHVLLFWIAFIFTRPFGATFGDFLTKSHAKGGLDLGTANASLVAFGVMAVLIVFSIRHHKND